jgi:hypothetical protein
VIISVSDRLAGVNGLLGMIRPERRWDAFDIIIMVQDPGGVAGQIQHRDRIANGEGAISRQHVNIRRRPWADSSRPPGVVFKSGQRGRTRTDERWDIGNLVDSYRRRRRPILVCAGASIWTVEHNTDDSRFRIQ